jgi:hypothetical protein
MGIDSHLNTCVGTQSPKYLEMAQRHISLSPAGWKSEWFYVKVDKDEDKLVQSPLELTFEETRPQCNMIRGSPSQIALGEFRIISEHIGTRDLVQEFLAFKVFPTMRD